MMKNLSFGLVVVSILLVSSVCWAQSAPPANFSVDATVVEQLELSGWVKIMSAGMTDPGTQGMLGSFPYPLLFSNLTDTLTAGGGAGCLYSPSWYAVFMVPKTSGRPYEITSACSSLAGSGTAAGYYLPDNSFVLSPEYNVLDEWVWGPGITDREAQGVDPNSGTVAGASSAVGTYTIYDSNGGGDSIILRAIYSIPPYPASGDPIPFTSWTPVPVDQRYGPYGGEVVITLTLN